MRIISIHGCWWLGFLTHKVISSHDGNYVGCFGCCLPYRRISLTCAVSVSPNNKQHKHIRCFLKLQVNTYNVMWCDVCNWQICWTVYRLLAQSSYNIYPNRYDLCFIRTSYICSCCIHRLFCPYSSLFFTCIRAVPRGLQWQKKKTSTNYFSIKPHQNTTTCKSRHNVVVNARGKRQINLTIELHGWFGSQKCVIQWTRSIRLLW